ncbi:MAG: peptidoglycan editing factor PgeF [Patescibacteria group bacterium]|nr:peptidoglycan editing factor PgeF [Patescibacteria group bacterium]
MFDLASFSLSLPLEREEGRFRFGFTTKAFGDGRDQDVRAKLLAQTGATTLVAPKQTHGSDVCVVDTDGNIPENGCDALVTNRSGLLLTVLTADCVPIIYLDRTTGVIGVSHQGWRGSLARMAQKTVEAMVKAGASVAAIEAFIGPAISGEVYDVTKDRYTTFRNEFFPYAHLFAKHRDGKYFLDLPELNVQQLLESGLGVTNITSYRRCTYSEPDQFFSYRRDAKTEFGEMLAYVCMKADTTS